MAVAFGLKLTGIRAPGYPQTPSGFAKPRRSEAVAQAGLAGDVLTKTGRGPIAAAMTDAATIFIARRRRILAVWADVCV